MQFQISRLLVAFVDSNDDRLSTWQSVKSRLPQETKVSPEQLEGCLEPKPGILRHFALSPSDAEDKQKFVTDVRCALIFGISSGSSH